MAEITVPPVGESISEGVLARWLKKDGDRVRAGDPVFELETDKATQEVPAPEDGILRITVSEGTKVSIGAVVGQIEAGAATEAPKKEPAAKKESPPPKKEAKPPAEPVL